MKLKLNPYTQGEVTELLRILTLSAGEKQDAIKKFCSDYKRTKVAVYAKLTDLKKGKGLNDAKPNIIQTIPTKAPNVLILDLEEIVVRGNKLMVYYR